MTLARRGLVVTAGHRIAARRAYGVDGVTAVSALGAAVALARAMTSSGGRAGATVPGGRRRSRSGPMRVRTRRVTGWPTASHIRRTWRLRPSWIVIRSTPGSGCDTLAGAVRPSSSSTPSRSRRSAPGADRSAARAHGGEVLLVDAVAGVGDAVGQLAVVGQQQQALGVGVEPTDREHPRLGRHELDDGRAGRACPAPS